MWHTTLVFSLLALSGIVAVKSQKLDPVNCDVHECTKCYNLLVWNVLNSSQNQYTRALFPPDTSNPVSVIVHYNFKDENGDINNSQLWSWSTSTYYHFHLLPLPTAISSPVYTHLYTLPIFKSH